MQCPLCINETLEAHFRGDVEIDMCPRCRGVWLDRGELDKLAHESVKISKPRERREPDRSREVFDRDDDRRNRNDNRRYSDDKKDRKKKKRKKGFGERLADVLEEFID